MKDTGFSARLDAFDALLVRRDDVISFLYSGQMIKAIKMYREDTGASLADAKAAVERMEQRMRMGISLLVEQTPVEQGAEAEPDNLDALIGEIARLITQQGKIHAIKFYREQTGVGLREAKEAIDRIASAMSLSGALFPQPGNLDADLRSIRYTSSAKNFDTEIQNLILAGQKIQAIKLYREQTGVGLREAKDAVDQMEQSLRFG